MDCNKPIGKKFIEDLLKGTYFNVSDHEIISTGVSITPVHLQVFSKTMLYCNNVILVSQTVQGLIQNR